MLSQAFEAKQTVMLHATGGAKLDVKIVFAQDNNYKHICMCVYVCMMLLQIDR